MFKKLLSLAAVLVFANVAVAQDAKLAKLEERVAELEAAQSLNIFNFSGTFTTRYDNVKYDRINTGTTTTPVYWDSVEQRAMRMKMALNMNANVSNKIKFYSTMSATKYWNKFLTGGTAATSTVSTSLSDDLSVANSYGGSSLYLEKAYFDYFFAENWAMSVGRLPSVNGPPSEFWDGVARQGTYPLHLYNSNLDGIAISHNMNRWMPQDITLDARLIYTPLQNINVANKAVPVTDVAGEKYPYQSDLVAAQLELGGSKPSWTDKWLLIYSYLRINPIRINFNANTTGFAFTDKIDYTFNLLNFQMNGIGGTGFDLHLMYASTAVKQDLYNAAGTNLNSALAQYFNTDAKGSGMLASARYRFNTANLLGVEYLSNTQYYFISESSSGNLSNFYGTNGTATHVYFTHFLESNLSLRVGMTQQNPKYGDFTGAAVPAETDKKVSGYYANLRLDF